MKSTLLALLAVGLLAALSGCGHVDVTPESHRNRVLTGTVATGVALPAGAEIAVRIIARMGSVPGQPPETELPVMRAGGAGAEQVIGEQVQKLAAPAGEPVPFRIEYEADDALLRRGVNLEARVFYNGRVRFRTVSAYAVALSSIGYPQHLTLQAVDR